MNMHNKVENAQRTQPPFPFLHMPNIMSPTEDQRNCCTLLPEVESHLQRPYRTGVCLGFVER